MDFTDKALSALGTAICAATLLIAGVDATRSPTTIAT